MPIRVTCSNCQAVYRAPSGSSGKKGKCPKCGKPICIPNLEISEENPFAEPPLPQPSTQTNFAKQQPIQLAVEQSHYESPRPTVISIEHSHSAKKGFFGAAFKGTLGCFAAIFVVLFGGCVVVSVLLLGGTAATVGVTGKITEEMVASQRIEDAICKKLVVTDASYHDPYEFSESKNILDFSIENKSQTAINRIEFHVEIKGKGRQIPYAKGDVSYSFSGGLEPGEIKDITITPSLLSGSLATVKAPFGSDLIVSITGADWPEKYSYP